MRWNRSPEFKAKVALTVAPKEKSIALRKCKQGVQVEQISAWRVELLEDASALLMLYVGHNRDGDADAKESLATTKALRMERYGLSNALKR